MGRSGCAHAWENVCRCAYSLKIGHALETTDELDAWMCLCLCQVRPCECGSISSTSTSVACESTSDGSIIRDGKNVYVCKYLHIKESWHKMRGGCVKIWVNNICSKNTYKRYALLVCVCVCMRVCSAMTAGWGGGWCFGSRSGTSFRPKPAEERERAREWKTGGEQREGEREERRKANRWESAWLYVICFTCTITKSSWRWQTKYRSRVNLICGPVFKVGQLLMQWKAGRGGGVHFLFAHPKVTSYVSLYASVSCTCASRWVVDNFEIFTSSCFRLETSIHTYLTKERAGYLCFASSISARHIAADEHIVFQQSRVLGMWAKMYRWCPSWNLRFVFNRPHSLWLLLRFRDSLSCYCINHAAIHTASWGPQSSSWFRIV